MTEKQKIQEGLIDMVFGALEKGIKKARKKATAKAMRDPKVKKIVSSIKKDLAEFDRIMAEYE